MTMRNGLISVKREGHWKAYIRHIHWDIYKKPQNRTNNNINNKISQSRNKFRSKLKTASKSREDVQAPEIVEAHIFRRETGKTPNRIE